MWDDVENRRFSGLLPPDWGNSARAGMAGLGSIGLNSSKYIT